MITFEEGQELLTLAKQALSFHFTEKAITVELSNSLCSQKEALFVTLYKNNVIRGRIGTFNPKKPLCNSIKEFTYAAAFDDPRYETIKLEEYSKIKISLAFLSRIKKITHSNQEEIEKKIEEYTKDQNAGILLSHKNHFTMILPNIIAKENLNARTILMKLLEEAEVTLNDLTNNEESTLVLFQAQIFKEN